MKKTCTKSPGSNECSCMIKKSFHLLAPYRQKKIVADLQYVGQRIVQVTVCLFWDDYLDPLHLAAYYDTCISV